MGLVLKSSLKVTDLEGRLATHGLSEVKAMYTSIMSDLPLSAFMEKLVESSLFSGSSSGS